MYIYGAVGYGVSSRMVHYGCPMKCISAKPMSELDSDEMDKERTCLLGCGAGRSPID